jgi:hypothetical protein
MRSDAVGLTWYTEGKSAKRFNANQGAKYVWEMAWIGGVTEVGNLQAV